jgi:diadenosine tetraphosphate (Ap4A) HIT family hydrolase
MGVLDSKFSTYTNIRERILLKSENFIVIPSISPLGINHLLIFPTIHISSLAQINHKQNKELYQIVKKVLKKLFDKNYSEKNKSFILFEHGVTKGQTGGCGVDHAHLHILPCDNDMVNEIFAKMTEKFLKPEKIKFDKINTIADSVSYLLIGDNLDNLFIYKASSFESQTIRKIICEYMNIDAWDWKMLTNSSAFEKTLQEWHAA